MFDTDPDGATLFSRIVAAFIGALSGTASYLVWVFFEARRWGLVASPDFPGLGKWFVLAGAALGFFGGFAFAAELCSNSWENLRDESAGFVVAVLVVVVAILMAFFIYKQLSVPT